MDGYVDNAGYRPVEIPTADELRDHFLWNPAEGLLLAAEQEDGERWLELLVEGCGPQEVRNLLHDKGGYLARHGDETWMDQALWWPRSKVGDIAADVIGEHFTGWVACGVNVEGAMDLDGAVASSERDVAAAKNAALSAWVELSEEERGGAHAYTEPDLVDAICAKLQNGDYMDASQLMEALDGIELSRQAGGPAAEPIFVVGTDGTAVRVDSAEEVRELFSAHETEGRDTNEGLEEVSRDDDVR